MRLRPTTIVATAAAMLLALGLAGCGGTSTSGAEATRSAATGSQGDGSVATSKASSTSATATAAQEKAPRIDIQLSTSVPAGLLSARYTCHGTNVSPVFRWQGVPKGTAELDLFVLSTLPIHGKFDVAWAVAGIKPSVSRISSAKLPSAVIVGRNSAGQNRYSLCPVAKSYTVLLYAVPHKMPVSQGFQAEPLVNKLVRIAGHEGSAFIETKIG